MLQQDMGATVQNAKKVQEAEYD